MALKNGKAAGPDDIPAEAIKVDIGTAVNMLHSLFSKIWEEEQIPAEWKEGILIKLPKKGDLRVFRELPRNHAPVSVGKSPEQSSTGEDERGSGHQAP